LAKLTQQIINLEVSYYVKRTMQCCCETAFGTGNCVLSFNKKKITNNQQNSKHTLSNKFFNIFQILFYS
jgi:hypothetical protein